jgi:A/G-specific adenine glycosylase
MEGDVNDNGVSLDAYRNNIIAYNSYEINVNEYRKKLIAWGKKNFRTFPWRLTRDPYKILVAEVMLKRTQARQVEPVYSRFIDRYPSLISLKGISFNELQGILQPLGLKYRVSMFYDTINILLDKYNGVIPEKPEELMSLPGLSHYSAGAVRCFAWGYPEALIDTNTMRIICRAFNKKPYDSLRRNKEFMKLMKTLVDTKYPRQYNYALLDLADKICFKKKFPSCFNCPLINICKTAGEYINYQYAAETPNIIEY